MVVPTVGLGPLEEELLQLAELLVGETRRWARRGFGLQAVGLSGAASPPVDGGSQDAQDAGDDRGGLAPFNEFNGAATAAFEFSSWSFWSPASLYARSAESVAFHMPDSVSSTCAQFFRVTPQGPDQRGAVVGTGG